MTEESHGTAAKRRREREGYVAAATAAAAVLIDGHTRQLAPLLIKPPSRLALPSSLVLPRLLVIVLNLTPYRGTELPRQFSSGKKPQAVRVTDSAAPLTFISVKGLLLRDFFVWFFFRRKLI